MDPKSKSGSERAPYRHCFHYTGGKTEAEIFIHIPILSHLGDPEADLNFLTTGNYSPFFFFFWSIKLLFYLCVTDSFTYISCACEKQVALTFSPMILSEILLYCLKQVTGGERGVYWKLSSAGRIDIWEVIRSRG